jgi:fructosamine-3-kinase
LLQLVALAQLEATQMALVVVVQELTEMAVMLLELLEVQAEQEEVVVEVGQHLAMVALEESIFTTKI